MKRLFISSVLIFSLLTGCNTTQKPVASDSEQEEAKETIVVAPPRIPAFKEHYPNFEKHVLQDSLHRYFAKKSLSRDFYFTNDFLPVWTKDTLNISGVNTLLTYFRSAGEHGLNPQYFNPDKIQTLVDSIEAGAWSNQMHRVYHALREVEYLSAQSLIEYVTGLKYGFSNPQKLFGKEYAINILQPDSSYYRKLFIDLRTNPDSLLMTAQPQSKTYRNLQRTLSFYASKIDSTFQPFTMKRKESYKLNEKDPIFPLIAKRLMITGELPYSKNADSLYASLTPQLLEAVNAFRANNSYPVENEIGKITIEALNRPMSYYYQALSANLERYRWTRQTPAQDKYIEVNVAAFKLKAIEPNQDPLLMNVCVGSVKNTTPLLESSISYINLNPTWSVPSSIIKKELYYSIKKDSAYLAKNRMKLIKDGEVVDPANVDWGTVDPNRFPYMIKQDPGNGNSLGRIKFMFSNPFSVYLHDTPAKRAFTYKNRAISHGCIRLQKPVELAYFCTEGIDSVYFDRIRYSIDQPPLTKEGKELLKKNQLKKVHDIVNLDKPIQLFVDYFTAYMLPGDDWLYFADDIYGCDKKILKDLQGRKLTEIEIKN